MIVDNGAADIGGAIMLDDSSNVALVNNTVANNVSTGSSENSRRQPALGRAGLRGQRPAVPGRCSAGTAPKFSNPVALFNNIFWNNEAFTLSQPGPGATLVSPGLHRLRGPRDRPNPASRSTRTPRYSLLTNGNVAAAGRQLRDDAGRRSARHRLPDRARRTTATSSASTRVRRAVHPRARPSPARGSIRRPPR